VVTYLGKEARFESQSRTRSGGMQPMNPQDAAQEYLAAEVTSADPLRRVALLHEGAARFTREAIGCVERREFEQAHNAFVRARNIILHFLNSIPETDDSDLAAHLRGLLQYTYGKLIEANLRKDPRCAQEALQVIRSLGEGWAELDSRRMTPPATEPPSGSSYLV